MYLGPGGGSEKKSTFNKSVFGLFSLSVVSRFVCVFVNVCFWVLGFLEGVKGCHFFLGGRLKKEGGWD